MTTHPADPACPDCMENDGVVATMQGIDGDESSIEFECPRCGRVAWVQVA